MTDQIHIDMLRSDAALETAWAEIERLRAELAEAQAERDAIGLRITREWQKIVDVLIEATKDDLAQNRIEGLIEYGPRFYAGKLSVLQHFREMIGDDLRRFSNGAALLAELAAARKVVEAAREIRNADAMQCGLFDALAAYDKEHGNELR